jgi:hypothetical protein
MSVKPGQGHWNSASKRWTRVILKELINNRPVIAEVRWGGWHTHFVVITGVAAGKAPDFLIDDPAQPPQPPAHGGTGLFASYGDGSSKRSRKDTRYWLAGLVLVRHTGWQMSIKFG